MKRNENNDFNLVAEIQSKVDELEDQEEVAVAIAKLKGSNNSENYVKNVYNYLKGAGIQKINPRNSDCNLLSAPKRDHQGPYHILNVFYKLCPKTNFYCSLSTSSICINLLNRPAYLFNLRVK